MIKVTISLLKCDEKIVTKMQAHKHYENCFRCGRMVTNSFLQCDENIVTKKQHVMKIVMNTVMEMMNKVTKIIKMVIFCFRFKEKKRLHNKRRNKGLTPAEDNRLEELKKIK